MEDNAKALEITEEVYTLRCEVLGVEHPDVINSMNNLAVQHSKLGHHREAIEWGERAYALRCKILGERHPDTLITLDNLSYCYQNAADLGHLLPILEKLYPQLEAYYGPDHNRTKVAFERLKAARKLAGGNE